MTELKTKDSLLRALKRASTRAPSAEEMEKQRVSFILGSIGVNSGVTRDQVWEILRKQEGKKAAK
jgi:hypothetical protein